jgi:two-component sensor histidine kinase
MLYYAQKKDWQRAYQLSQQNNYYIQNQILQVKNGAIAHLSFEYQTEKKEIELRNRQRQLEETQKNQRIQAWLLGGLAVLLVGAIVTSAFWYRTSQKNEYLSKQNAALVHEQNHRVKNNLQLVSGLLTLQLNRLTDPVAKMAVEDSHLRIEVMGLLQRKLYDNEDINAVSMADFLRDVTEMILKSFGMMQVEVLYQIDAALTLPPDYAMRVGFIVNELVTNACKYAFDDHPHPVLSVGATLIGNSFKLKIKDNGKGFDVAKIAPNSFGMRLIQMQIEQYHGSYRFYNQDGTAFEASLDVVT